MSDVSNSEDVLDSRDVIKRISELEDERDALDSDVEEAQEAFDEADSALSRVSAHDVTPGDSDDVQALRAALKAADDALTAAKKAREDWNETDEAEELKALNRLADEASGYADDWHYGATLIRESYFTEYAENLVSEIGDMPRELPSYIVIDWEATAKNLKADYTEVDFDGVTYLVR